jgi:Asp/Glu/hydantoin racemase
MRDAITVDSAEAVCAACCGFPGIEQEIKDLLGVPMFMPHQISLAVAEQIADAGRNYEVSALLV